MRSFVVMEQEETLLLHKQRQQHSKVDLVMRSLALFLLVCIVPWAWGVLPVLRLTRETSHSIRTHLKADLKRG